MLSRTTLLENGMKHVLIPLFLAVTFTLAAQLPPKPAPTHRELVAAYLDCFYEASGTRDCGAIRDQAEVAYQRESAELAQRLHANTAKIQQSMAEIQAITDRWNAYAVCRQHRRWFQFWKRPCRGEYVQLMLQAESHRPVPGPRPPRPPHPPRPPLERRKA